MSGQDGVRHLAPYTQWVAAHEDNIRISLRIRPWGRRL